MTAIYKAHYLKILSKILSPNPKIFPRFYIKGSRVAKFSIYAKFAT